LAKRLPFSNGNTRNVLELDAARGAPWDCADGAEGALATAQSAAHIMTSPIRKNLGGIVKVL